MRGPSINSFYDGFSQRCVFIEKDVSTKKIREETYLIFVSIKKVLVVSLKIKLDLTS